MGKSILELSRRANAVALRRIAIAGVMALAPMAVAAAETFTLASAGGAYDACVKQAFLNDFGREANVTPAFGSPYYDMGVWKAQQESKSYEWDFSIADANQVDQLIDSGWLVPIDPKALEGRNLVDYPGLVTKRGDAIYAIPAEIFGNVIAYNTDKFGAKPPQNWADVFDLAKYPGKRLFSKQAADFGVLEMALLADGVQPNNLYPLDVDRALRKLDTIKSEILWYESGAQQIALLQQGDAVIGAAWDGRVKALQKDGGKVDFTPNQALIRPDLWVIPKGGNAELGNKFVAYLTQPEKQAKFATCIGYTPAWKDAYPLLPKDQKFTVNPDSMANLVSWNGAYWKDNAKPVMDKFNEWLTK